MSPETTNFGWKFQIKIYIPVIAEGDPAPPDLLDVIQSRAISGMRMPQAARHSATVMVNMIA